MSVTQVSIALKPNVYNTFRNLVNTLSNTLGEYVDNAVQSYFDNKKRLRSYEPNYKLQIKIIMDWEAKSLSVIDNAAGINEENYTRAFEPANIPENNAGLNEYGMGMKTASVWLADNWTVTTKALGENVERVTSFDLQKVTNEGREILEVEENQKPLEEHYTKIVLTNLSKNAPRTNAMEKVKKHLSSIYRVFLRTGEIEIYVNGEKLTSPEYRILNAPFYKNPGSDNILWKKEINLDAGRYKARGFLAILEEINQGENGLVLLRRGRVIVGGGDERFFPSCLFGSVGTFKYKRLFGELELEGFEVTFNKNGFKSEDDLQMLLEDIKRDISSEKNNIFMQAEGYRQRSKEKKEKIAQKIKKTLSEKVSDNLLFENKAKKDDENIKNTELIKKNENLINESTPAESYSEKFICDGKDCSINYELITETESTDLYSVQEHDGNYICKINLSHSFFDYYPQFKNSNGYEPLIKILMAFAKAELNAPSRGTKNPGNLRNLFNQYILES